MKFYDVHTHLDLCENPTKAISKAKDKNVHIITVGINKETNRKSLEFSQNANVDCCLGIYPTETTKLSQKEFQDELKFIEQNKNKLVGIAEIGLDKKEKGTENPKTFDLQKQRFIEQVKLAIKINKPIVVHSRKAEEETIKILKKLKTKNVVMHCFSGKIKFVEEIIKEGWFLSIPSNCKFSEQFQKNIALTPINQILCETDSPFLHPDKLQGMTNESANVIESYKKISEIKKITLKETQKIIEANYKKVFT